MALGLAAAAVAALLANLGLILQKIALDRRSADTRVFRVFFTPMWLAGLCMTQSGWLAQLIALRRAPLYIVQPIIASGLLVLAAAARIKLRERVGAREWASVSIIAISASLLALLALSAQSHTSAVAPTRSTVTFVAIVAAAAALIAAASRFAGPRRSVGLAISAGSFYALTVILSKPISAMLDGSPETILRSVLASYEIYLIAVLSVAALLVNQHALAAGRAVTVVPIVVVSMALIPVTAGFVVFGENLPTGSVGLVTIIAAAACVLGAALLASDPSVAGLVGDDDRSGASSNVV